MEENNIVYSNLDTKPTSGWYAYINYIDRGSSNECIQFPQLLRGSRCTCSGSSPHDNGTYFPGGSFNDEGTIVNLPLFISECYEPGENYCTPINLGLFQSSEDCQVALNDALANGPWQNGVGGANFCNNNSVMCIYYP
jgi:hypothetical protein